MSKRIFAIVISAVLLTMSFGLQTVFAQGATSDLEASKVRAKVETLGNNAKVEVKLRDNTKVKGNISDITPVAFTVADSKTGTTNTLAFTDVAEVKKAGGGLSSKGWILIGAAVAGAVVTWILIKPVLCDGGAQSRGPC